MSFPRYAYRIQPHRGDPMTNSGDKSTPRTLDDQLLQEKGLNGSAHTSGAEIKLTTQTAEEIADTDDD